MIKSNPQLRNVGNLGDILKHAALMNLAKLLIGRCQSRFAYVESHTFMLEAPCPNPEQWMRETISELTNHVAFSDYFTTEKSVTDNLPYRCSAGLVIDELRKSNIVEPALILAEKDSATREVLKGQLVREQVENCTILEDALQLSAQEIPDDVDTLLVLVDPFVLDDGLWNSLVAALDSIIRPGSEIVLELFTFDAGQAVVRWPSPPAYMIGPVSVMHRQPYHLAVYATEAVSISAAACCQLYQAHSRIFKGRICSLKSRSG